MKTAGILAALALLVSGCVTTTPTREAGPDAARANAQLALAYLQRGDVDLAMEKAERAIEQDDSYAEGYLVKGMILARAEEFDDADDYYRRAARYGKDNATVLGNVAAYWCERQRYSDGEQLFLDISRMPTYGRPAVALTNAGLCAQRAPALDRAERHFRRALELEPNYAQALSQMADLSFRQGEWLNARGFLQRLEGVRRLGPDGLWLGVRIERALEDRRAEQRYTDILLRDFPQSREAGLLMQKAGGERQ